MKGERDAWKDKCKDVLPRNGNKNRTGARFPPLMYAYRQTLGRQHLTPVRGHVKHTDALLRKLFASSGSSMTWVQKKNKNKAYLESSSRHAFKIFYY